MNNLKIWALPLLCLCLFGCKEKGLTEEQSSTLLPSGKSTAKTFHSSTFAVGADLSSVPKDVAKGAVYYDKNGVATEAHQLFKNLGANAVRIRVWVNHTQGYSNKASVVEQSVLARSLGYRIMIDFHYSDTWADPGHQYKPVAWNSYTLTQLKDAVYNHTYDVLDSLKDNGIYPEWVQVGNETNNGMLWDTGKASTSMSNYAALTNKGYDAVKAVSPTSKVIVHVAGGDNMGSLQFIYGGLNTTGGKYDVIGVSLYPSNSGNNWQAANNQCFANLKSLATQFNKEVMVVETGLSWQDAAKCKEFVADLINKIRHIPDGKGLGVFYWAPESISPFTDYDRGMMNMSTARPTIATDAFRDSVNINYIHNPDFEENGVTHNPSSWYCTNGTGTNNGSYTQTAGIYNGNYKLGHFKNVNYTVKTYQVASNIPNGIYILKAWVKSSGGQDTCQLIAKEYAGSGIQKAANITASSSWKLIQIPNIQVTNSSCKVVLYSKAYANNWVNLDGVKLLKQ